jgi:hypothetical protein
MNEIRRSNERGQADHGWLRSQHSFSFADYFDPEHLEFGPLRVINEDRVQAGAGFGTHGHRNMEIISYVLAGKLAHKDSMGNGSGIGPGDVQRMSAGTGVMHSEFNPSATEPVHFLQIWILPNETGLKPGYEQRSFDLEKKSRSLVLVAAPDAREGALKVHQDAELSLAVLPKGEKLNYNLRAGRQAWVQVGRGKVTLNGSLLDAGDGAAISGERVVDLTANDRSEILLFDLA